MSTAVEEVTELTDITEGEATCEIVWPGTDEECGRPATHIATIHGMSHEYQDALICDPCLVLAKNYGLLDPRATCLECGAKPMTTQVRPA